MLRSLGKTLHTGFQNARLRTQLLVTVNVFVAIVMTGYLYFDYQYSIESQIRDKTISLSEEARIIEVAVQELRPLGTQAIQRHLNTICATMNAGESPGHTIEVFLDGTSIVSEATEHDHDHSSPWSELVSGVSVTGDVMVRVGERRQPLIAKVRRHTLARIGVVSAMTVVGALILNLLLLRLVTRPLEQTVRAVRDVGRGKLGRTVEVSANHELTQLAYEVTQMSLELARRNTDRNAQIDRAHRLQSHLIPKKIERTGIGIAIEFHPADEIAGDFVDAIECPNGDTLLCVADVVGHGIHAAMGAAVLKALLLSVDMNDPSPASMLDSINRRYYKTSLPEDFASMILMRVSGDASRMVYASAGHELGYHRHADGTCDDLPSTGTVLGVSEQPPCEDLEVDLELGDLVVLLTDGVSETFNTEHQLLGRDVISSAVKDPKYTGASALAGKIIDLALTHRKGTHALDDMTVLALEVTGISSKGTITTCDHTSHREHR